MTPEQKRVIEAAKEWRRTVHGMSAAAHKRSFDELVAASDALPADAGDEAGLAAAIDDAVGTIHMEYCPRRDVLDGMREILRAKILKA